MNNIRLNHQQQQQQQRTFFDCVHQCHLVLQLPSCVITGLCPDVLHLRSIVPPFLVCIKAPIFPSLGPFFFFFWKQYHGLTKFLYLHAFHSPDNALGLDVIVLFVPLIIYMPL